MSSIALAASPSGGTGTAGTGGGGGAGVVMHGPSTTGAANTNTTTPPTTTAANTTTTTSPVAPTKPPSSSTFSFKAPALPYNKQRRGSLALPSSPRVVEGYNFRDDTGLLGGVDSPASSTEATSAGGSAPLSKRIRKFESSSAEADSALLLSSSSPVSTPEKPEKKARKKWSEEETKMLVAGCNKHGVGNWKTILRDSTLIFDSRSPVDLKDRFRTYFPDAYKLHYPNAKTHLSSKVRSTLPDGTPLFEKTRSKRRRPFTEEEDRALEEGYHKYGTVWATIVKEYPIFQEQNRRSTDLRDRFRNAFPVQYQKAGYKPRNAAKKKMAAAAAAAAAENGGGAGSSDGGGGVGSTLTMPMARRAATDEQLGTTSTGGPVRSRRRAHTSQGLLRGGTKSVPQSTACTEDEDSSGGEEEGQMSPIFKVPQTPALADAPSSPSKKFVDQSMPYDTVEDEEMDMITLDPLAEALALPDLMSNHENHSHAWSSGVSTPTHSNHWSTAAGSPTSSHLSSDMLMNAGSHPSPFLQRRSDSLNSNNNMGMIGKSAWGTDWFSPNPRLDPSSNGAGSSSSYLDQPSPASPFSFHQLNQNVLDRYDLFPTSMPSDFSSEVGIGDSHSTFSDELFQPSGFRGFTHHSSYAGDLIFGARTHQQQNFLPSSIGGGGGFGFGSLGLTGLSSVSQQQQQQQQNAGIHPMQLHTPSMLSGIDESGIGGLVLDDSIERGGGSGDSADPLGIPLPPESMDEDLEDDVAMGDVVQASSSNSSPGHRHLQQHQHQQHLQHQQHQQMQGQRSPSKHQDQDHHHHLHSHVHHHHQHHMQHQQQQQQQRTESSESSKNNVMLEPFGLDDLVDLSNELHTTPPATPLTHPRPLRRSSVTMLHHFPSPGSLHARSVSVPPSEFRTSTMNGGSALVDYNESQDEVGQQQQQIQLQHRMAVGDLMGGRILAQPSISQQLSQGQQQQQQQQQDVRGGVTSPQHQQRRRGRSVGAEDHEGEEDGGGAAAADGGNSEDEDEHEGTEEDPRPQTPTLASRHLLSLPIPVTPSMSSSSSSSSSLATSNSGIVGSSAQQSPISDDLWKPSSYASQQQQQQHHGMMGSAADLYNLPFLDLHYYGHGSSLGGALHGMMHPGIVGSGGDDMGGGGYLDGSGVGHQMQQAHALDLAATVVSGGVGGGLGIGTGGVGGGVNGGGGSRSTLKSIDASSFGNFLGGKSTQLQQLSHLHNSNNSSSQQQQQGRRQQVVVGGSQSSGGFMQDFERHQQQQQQHGGHGSNGHIGSHNNGHAHHHHSTSLGGGSAAQQEMQSLNMGIFKQSGGVGLPSGMTGRSQSHHRGQSAVNPQDLMMRSDNNKRKRASWDGRQV